jgi:hypothetical protein
MPNWHPCVELQLHEDAAFYPNIVGFLALQQSLTAYLSKIARYKNRKMGGGSHVAGSETFNEDRFLGLYVWMTWEDEQGFGRRLASVIEDLSSRDGRSSCVGLRRVSGCACCVRGEQLRDYLLFVCSDWLRAELAVPAEMTVLPPAASSRPVVGEKATGAWDWPLTSN